MSISDKTKGISEHNLSSEQGSSKIHTNQSPSYLSMHIYSLKIVRKQQPTPY